MSSSQRILLISDLHATVGGLHEDETHLSFTNRESAFADSLLQYLSKIDSRCDLLVCAGDIANKADRTAFEQGWAFVNRLRDSCAIPELLAVPGNHDHDSRGNNSIDPKTCMQFVEPRFPTLDFEWATHFWAWNWMPKETDVHNALLVNTSAYHGLKVEGVDHGRILPEIRAQIVDYARLRLSPKRINYLVCHHHPVYLPRLDGQPDTQSADGGLELLEEIGRLNLGPWLVFHGHRHLPRITYASSGGGDGPLIFSAGSISAKLNAELGLTSNQFCIVEIDLDETDRTGKAVGTFETHEWHWGSGWQESKSRFLPFRGGFGSTRTPKEIGKTIDGLVDRSRVVTPEVLATISAQIRYLTPDGLSQLDTFLSRMKVFLRRDGNQALEAGRLTL